MAAPYLSEAGQPASVLSSRCPTHRTLLQSFDHQGREFRRPVCYACLPAHHDRCPGWMRPVEFCICARRIEQLEIASVGWNLVEQDAQREQELEQAYSAGAITADSWAGSLIMRAERKTVLAIVAGLWSLEFNWYFLLDQNATRHAAHQAHLAECHRSICGDVRHLRPDCPPQHTWILDWPSFTDELIESVWCNPRLAGAWEELVCWRADVQYWLARTPKWARVMFDLRAKGTSERDIAHQMGTTRYMARKRLKWLGRFLSNAAESWWSHAKSTRELRQVEMVLAAITNAESRPAGVPHASDSTSQGANASHTHGQTSDPEALPAESQAADRGVHAGLACAPV